MTRPRAKPTCGSSNPAILDLDGVRLRLGYQGKASVYRVRATFPDFPQPFRRLHERGFPMWWAADVDTWIARHFGPSEERA